MLLCIIMSIDRIEQVGTHVRNLGEKVAEIGISLQTWAEVRRLQREAQQAQAKAREATRQFEVQLRRRDTNLQTTPLINEKGEFLMLSRGFSPASGPFNPEAMVSRDRGYDVLRLTPDTTKSDLAAMRSKLEGMGLNLSELEPSQNHIDPKRRTLTQQTWFFKGPDGRVDAVSLDYNRRSGLPEQILIAPDVMPSEDVPKKKIYPKSAPQLF